MRVAADYTDLGGVYSTLVTACLPSCQQNSGGAAE